MSEHHDTNSTHELIEIYSPDGQPTNQAKPRSIIHQQGLWHKTVHTWILETSTKRLLLQRRSPLKLNHPNQWDCSSAGHISFGQASDEAAMREVEEELGLQISLQELGQPIGTMRVQLVLNEGTYLDNEFIDVYLVKREVVEVDKLKLQESEVCDAQLVHYRVVEECYRKRHGDFVILDNVEEFKKEFFERVAKELNDEGSSVDLDQVWPSFIPRV